MTAARRRPGRSRPLEPHRRRLVSALCAGPALAVLAVVAGVSVPVAVVLMVCWATAAWPRDFMLPADRRTGLPHPGRSRRARCAERWCRELWLPRPVRLVGFGDPGDAVGASRSWWPPVRVSSWWSALVGAVAGFAPMPPPVSWWIDKVSAEPAAGLPGWYSTARRASDLLAPLLVFWCAQAGMAAWRATRTELEVAPAALLRAEVVATVARSKGLLLVAVGLAAAAIGWVASAVLEVGLAQRAMVAGALSAVAALGVGSWLYCRAVTGPWWYRLEQQERWTLIWRQVGLRPDQIPTFAVDDAVSPLVTSVIFAAAPGVDPVVYREARKLGNALGSSQVLVAPVMDSNELGELVAGTAHPNGFRVSWATGPLGPSPHLRTDLDPETAEFASNLALRNAFASLRLGDPLMVLFQPIGSTADGATLVETLWRLAPGVTYEEVAKRVPALAEKLGVEWLRVGQWQTSGQESGELPTGMVSVLYGPRPDRVPALPAGVRRHLDRLDWDWIWQAAGVLGPGGEAPQLIARTTVRPQLFELEFGYAAGAGYPQIVKVIERVKAAAGMGFVLPQRSPDPSRFQLVVAPADPMPQRVARPAPDVAAARGGSRFAIGVGVRGEEIGWEPGVAPHGLVLGLTQSGKSVVLQNFLLEAICADWDAEVIDTDKHGADFSFARPWCAGWAVDLAGAVSLLEKQLQNIGERKAINAQHGVSKWTDLPLEAQPRPVLLLVDEAFMMVAPAAGKSDEAKADNAAKEAILDMLGRIARGARAAGVHMVLGAQRADRPIMKGEMIQNLGLRIAMGPMGPIERNMAFRAPELAPVLTEEQSCAGRGVFEQVGRPTTIFQGYFAAASELTAMLTRLAPIPRSTATGGGPTKAADPAPWLGQPPETWN